MTAVGAGVAAGDVGDCAAASTAMLIKRETLTGPIIDHGYLYQVDEVRHSHPADEYSKPLIFISVPSKSLSSTIPSANLLGSARIRLRLLVV